MTLLETLEPYFQENAPWKKGVWGALSALGLPTKGWDSFRYISLKQLNTGSFILKDSKEIHISSAVGIIALPLNSAMRSYGALLQKGFQKSLKEEINPYALLNSAFANEGLFLYIPPGKTIEMEWTFPAPEEDALFSPKVEVFVGKGASLSISYRFQGKKKYFHNSYFQFTLDEGATVSLDEHLEHSSEAFAMHTIRVHLKKKAFFKAFTFTKGALVERHDIQATLEGEKSSVDLKGLSIASKKDEVHHFISVCHLAPNCRSSQHYKTALMGRARSSFEGKIFVEKEAQKTEAYQLNNHLLLSPKAQAHSKPNLEIKADDVKASHGATCSRPKEDELFYLQTRGLSKEEAMWHLARGFCYELAEGKEIDRFLYRGQEDEPL